MHPLAAQTSTVASRVVPHGSSMTRTRWRTAWPPRSPPKPAGPSSSGSRTGPQLSLEPHPNPDPRKPFTPSGGSDRRGDSLAGTPPVCLKEPVGWYGRTLCLGLTRPRDLHRGSLRTQPGGVLSPRRRTAGRRRQVPPAIRRKGVDACPGRFNPPSPNHHFRA